MSVPKKNKNPKKGKTKNGKSAPTKPKESGEKMSPSSGASKTSAGSLTDILDDDAVTALRKGYDPKIIAVMARKAFANPYGPAGEFADAIISQFYATGSKPNQLQPRDREIALLGRFAANPDMNFKTHVYLGVVTGISPVEVVNVVYLSALYGGADIWTGAAAAIGATFTAMAKAAASGTATTMDVLKALRG